MKGANANEEDDAAARDLLRRARAVVAEVTGGLPDAQVAVVFNHLAVLEADRGLTGDAFKAEARLLGGLH